MKSKVLITLLLLVSVACASQRQASEIRDAASCGKSSIQRAHAVSSCLHRLQRSGVEVAGFAGGSHVLRMNDVFAGSVEAPNVSAKGRRIAAGSLLAAAAAVLGLFLNGRLSEREAFVQQRIQLLTRLSTEDFLPLLILVIAQ